MEPVYILRVSVHTQTIIIGITADETVRKYMGFDPYARCQNDLSQTAIMIFVAVGCPTGRSSGAVAAQRSAHGRQGAPAFAIEGLPCQQPVEA